MGWIRSLEQRAAQQWSPSAADDFWYGPAQLGGTSSGVKVTPDSARQLTAVLRAVTLLSGVVGMLPIKVYRDLYNGEKEQLPRDPIQKLLRWKPNRWQSAFQWKQLMEMHLDLRGNAFSRVERDAVGRPTALIPWHPDSVKIEVTTSRILYKLTRRNGTEVVVPHEDMLHIRGLGTELIGYSPIALAAESLGVGFAAQTYGARFFGNDSRPGGVLKMPGTLKKDSRDNLERTWKAAHTGANQHAVAVLEEGLEFQAIGIAPEEAQFLETRNFQIDEVARIFGVPPHMLMQNNRSTFNNVEHQGQEFDQYTMQPRVTNWEQEIKRTLLDGREDVYVEFLMDAMLRADTKTRAESNAIRFMNGNLSVNEWRRMENQNPVDTEGGDSYFVPLNLVPLDIATDPVLLDESTDTAPEEDEEDRSGWHDLTYLTAQGVENRRAMAMGDAELRSAASRHRQMRAFRPMLKTSAERVVRREVKQVRRAITASTSKDDLRSRIAEVYKDFAAVVARELHPSLRTYAETIFAIAVREVGSSEEWGADEDVFMQQYSDNVGVRHSVSSENQLEQLVDEAEDHTAASAAVDERVGEWDETRAGKMASRESVQANGAISRLAYTAAGVSTLVWVTIGDDCPLCSSLDGRTVGTTQNFVDAGDTVEATGTAPLTPRTNVGHPPLHQGCDCLVVAG